jgi:hypothetical protein
VPAKEFEETEHKAAAMRRSIEIAAGLPDASRPGTGAAGAPEPAGAEAPA